MKKPLILVLTTLFLTACGSSYQHRSGDNSRYEYDLAQCEAEAKAFVEERKANQEIPTETVTRCSGNSDGYTFNANCTSSERKNPYSGLGAAIGHAITTVRTRHKCMEAKGYE